MARTDNLTRFGDRQAEAALSARFEERPSWPWFLLLDGGIAIVAALALSRQTYETAREIAGDALPPREVCQGLLAVTVMAHALEALIAGGSARRAGLAPRRWRRRTLVVGFPSLLALRRTTRAVRRAGAQRAPRPHSAPETDSSGLEERRPTLGG